MTLPPTRTPLEGILIVDKPVGKSSFALVDRVRRICGVKRVGHAGTLDPFASGVLVLLIGRVYTRLSDRYMHHTKVYSARVQLGQSTDTYDNTGRVLATSDRVPTLNEINVSLKQMSGLVLQVPPMFSAKRVGGQRLYTLARRGEVIERAPSLVEMQIELIAYDYPNLDLKVVSGKGAYMRSLAYDLGQALGSEGHLTALVREKSGEFSRERALPGQRLFENVPPNLTDFILHNTC